MKFLAWRRLLALVLALALPLQAWADLRLCGGPALATAMLAPALVIAPQMEAALPPCHEMAAATAAADEAPAQADEHGGRCSACAASACCHAPALLPSLPQLGGMAPSQAPDPAPAAARERMLTGGLDRPPRRA